MGGGASNATTTTEPAQEQEPAQEPAQEQEPAQ